MSIFIPLFMSIAVNLDNFVIGIQLGMQNQPISVLPNMIISAITGLFAGLAALSPEFFPAIMINAANITGAAIIILFGIYCLLKRPEPDKPPLPGLSIKNSCILGFTLAVNCIPPSLGAGILGVPPLYMALFCCGASFSCMHISSRIGMKMRRTPFVRQLDKLSSILLIFIGITGVLMPK